MPRLPALSGSALVLLGAVCWSLNSPLVKYLTLDPFLICGLRSLIAGLVLLPFVRPREIAWNRYLLAYVLAYCALCLSVIVSLSLTSAAIAIGMQYTATIWLFLLYWFQTRYFSRRAFLPVAVIMAGVLCFMLSGGSGDSHPLGNLIALTEGIFFAGMSLASKKPPGPMLWGSPPLGTCSPPWRSFSCSPPPPAALPAMNGQEWGLMLILGVVQVAGATDSSTWESRKSPPGKLRCWPCGK